MRRRGIIGVLAGVLVILGTVLIVKYVGDADARALAGQEPVPVLVVKSDVPVGTLGKNVGTSVELRSLPKAAVVAGAISDPAKIPQDRVTSTTLKTGEQLLDTRFVAANSDEVTAQVPLPAGMQQLAIELPPERVVGSKLQAGDLVGIYLTLGDVTDVVAHKVLVLRAQGAVAQPQATPGSDAADKTPGGSVILTLAVDSTLAQRIIFAKENGKLWLTQQNEETTTNTRQVNAGNVFVK